MNTVLIGSNFLKQRNNLGLNQSKMAALLEVTQSFLSRVESGDSQPSLDVVLRAAAVFGCTTDCLIGGA
jgi:transcriptional regulator with XRE-family HTH domain